VTTTSLSLVECCRGEGEEGEEEEEEEAEEEEEEAGEEEEEGVVAQPVCWCGGIVVICDRKPLSSSLAGHHGPLFPFQVNHSQPLALNIDSSLLFSNPGGTEGRH